MRSNNHAGILFGLDADAAPPPWSARRAGMPDLADFAPEAPFREEDTIAICDGIVDLLAIVFNVSSRQLRSSRRTAMPVARVRQIGMYIAHVTLGLKMAAVGAGFGRDKSTVLHSCHTIEDLRDDADFDLIVARMERLVMVAFSFDKGMAGRND
jgi:Bacterial dnaA protein helix-turn-helix